MRRRREDIQRASAATRDLSVIPSTAAEAGGCNACHATISEGINRAEARVWVVQCHRMQVRFCDDCRDALVGLFAGRGR